MLASTVQFSNNERSPSRARRRLPAPRQGEPAVPPTDRARHEATSRSGLFPQAPTACLGDPRPPAMRVPSPTSRGVLARCRPMKAAVVDVPPLSTTPNAYGSGLVSAHTHTWRARQKLLRKEV